jgi:peptidoglycan/xylan/chitin deacetylase (PgdA/CDA1 family)
MQRREFLALTAALRLTAAPDERKVAITMDDFAWRSIPEPWRDQANSTLLQTLASRNLKAAIFVAGHNVDDDQGLSLVRKWGDAGHIIGNHTYTHPNFNGESATLAAFTADVNRNNKLLSTIHGYQKLLRFPFLKEGRTASQRDQMRAWMHAHGYRNGAVTIDASDWYYDSRLEQRLKAEPGFDISRYREPYLAHMLECASRYDALARDVIGRSPAHTVLVHYNLINTLFLADLLKAFESQGWKLISAAEAFADPVFRSEPKTEPAGESLIWALAKEHGGFETRLRYPGEDDVYEKPKLDRLGL